MTPELILWQKSEVGSTLRVSLTCWVTNVNIDAVAPILTFLLFCYSGWVNLAVSLVGSGNLSEY